MEHTRVVPDREVGEPGADRRRGRRGFWRLPILLAVVGGAAAALFVAHRLGAWDWARTAFSSVESMRGLVSGFGAWAPAVFFAAQAAQVVLAPIPGGVTVVVGTLVFGPWWGTALSVAGGVAGSAVLFALVRRWGRPLAARLVGREALDRYAGALDGRGLWLFLVMLVPFAPDDVVVALAGLSKISFRRFVVLVALGRLPSWAATAFVTADLVGRSAATLATAGLVLVVLAAAAFAYRGRLEGWLLRLAGEGRKR